MNLPVTLPDWMPWWLALLILLPACLYALALLAMPFSVLGLKSRLASVEARLDEIQGEIRSLALRLPEPVLRGGMEAPRREDPPPVAPRAAPLRAMPERPRRPGWEEAPEPDSAQGRLQAQEQEAPWMMSPPEPPVEKPRPNLPLISKRPSYPSLTRLAPEAAGEPVSQDVPPPRQPVVPPSWLRARNPAGPMPSMTPPPPSAEPPLLHEAPHETSHETRGDDPLAAPSPPVNTPPNLRRPQRPLVRAERRDPEDEGRTVRAEPRIDWPR